MKFKKITSHVKRNLLNLPGWRTQRKIVVIESDDWGSIRMASKDAYQYFFKKGYPVDKCPYNRYDALECNEDLEKLFEVLLSVKDINGNPAIITANSVVANPDFEKIKAHDYQEYFYEIFTTTLKNYPEHDQVYDLYKEGINNKLLMVQFHGREHLNVASWMKALQYGDEAAHQTFEKKMFSVHINPDQSENKFEYMDALNFKVQSEIEHHKQILSEGISVFQKIWGFVPGSFIAPMYIWSNEIQLKIQQLGIKYIQGMVVQNVPRSGDRTDFKIKYHYNGQRNSLGQIFLVRNAFFEPSQTQEVDWFSDCLHRITVAFRWNKPAIISSHRLNFIGFIDPSNRHRNLALFKKLLMEIVKRWPNVEFMTSSQLGDLMNCGKSNETIC